MKCVILAAGEGIRMRPLTLDTPKPMVRVLGKPLLEYIIAELPEEVTELIVVVGYKGEQIRKYFGDQFGRFSVKYVVQTKKAGTYDALKLCQSLIGDDERFMMLYADDIHGRAGLEECAKSDGMSLTVKEVSNPERFGIVETDKDGMITGVEEKPKVPKTNLASTGAMTLSRDVFNFPPPQNSCGEYVLAESIGEMVNAGYKIKAVRSSVWIPVGYPEDLKKVEEYLEKKD
jgi:NDP-sugar pyrophosphorylase family protein